ncbi:MAG TPA: TetR/AcrR family transcriptional regulator [Rectinema sp.]|jgi:AcrR family transcriptional regulator|nr:TetR/AcrR family transcriptional regulator [Treponema sp.]HNV35675.1 TetR/AcrR family transcriptional regulator [Rectinema sp.]HPD69023.1 TetR/AcrR family transcriptional regulator [Rectinema sp.]HPK79014.1 TetR/AcrR family transcriptional regulator [Rectinema sp.]HRS31861.1 TetR/AcrR family transcriptional regulator [Rectinema sp.]
MARVKTKEKRTLILETAKRLFATKGESVSMNGIAKEIGISVGSIYTYFPSKQSLIETIIEEGWDEYRVWVEDRMVSIMESGKQDDGIGLSLCALSFLVDEALPKLFSDVELIMILLAGASSNARLEKKLQYLSSMISKLVEDSSVSLEVPLDAKFYRIGIMVFLLGALETIRITSKTDIDINAADIRAFLRQLMENALGQPLPDRD